MGKGSQRPDELTCDKKDTPRVYTWEEIHKHRTPEDAWMVLDGKVYDVSGWYDHPGGNVIFTHAGDDFTDIFASFHAPNTRGYLGRFYIGEVDTVSIRAEKSVEQENFEKDYRTLRNQLITMGMFNASAMYYVYKVCSVIAIAAIAISLIAFTTPTMGTICVSATIMALFWQQCGWLAHDFLHHQVFKKRLYGNLMGVLVGNIFQGFSVAWWKNKHNTHHAVPNLVESSPDAHDGDPDIDTMPLLAWSLRMAEKGKDSSNARFMIKLQPFLYFPILLIARISWLIQSFFYVFDSLDTGLWSTKGSSISRMQFPLKKVEMIGLLIHYAWYGYVLFGLLSIPQALLYFIISQTMCGLFLALVFGVGHNGMAVYNADARPDFWKLQVTTTRNVTDNPLTSFFCGGLQYQVDHHLFPMIPRHNLRKVHILVESFCKAHNVYYHEAGMIKGNVEVLQHLASVSREFIKEFPAL